MKSLKPYEKIAMSFDELSRQSVCINFDITDDYNLPTRQGGYVMSRLDYEDECFYIVVVNSEGDVLSETKLPFDFKEVSE